MLPHGTRWAANPRVTTHTRFANSPNVATVRAIAHRLCLRNAMNAK